MDYINFYGNLYACPFGKRVEDCPICSVDSLSFRDKYNWFESSPERRKESIIRFHERCVKDRTLKQAEDMI